MSDRELLEAAEELVNAVSAITVHVSRAIDALDRLRAAVDEQAIISESMREEP